MTNTAEFLPKDYEQPKMGGGYMKFVNGENKFRILSKPIIGWLDWTADRKPMRFLMEEKPQPINSKKPLKHFWAMVVWNYSDNAIQILEITQSSIQAAIRSLTQDGDWGAPYAYDIKVIRKGTTMEDTEYAVNPSPHKAVPDEVAKAFLDRPCSLETLYNGDDPWAATANITEMQDMPF